MLDIPFWTPEIFKENVAECQEFLEDWQNWQKIPLLNYTPSDRYTDMMLIRFRGMVQDMLDTEIYLEKYEVTSSNNKRIQDGKYYDCLVLKSNESVNFNSPFNKHGERRAIFLVSVPGINPWAYEYEEHVTRTNIKIGEVPEEDKGTSVSGGKKRDLGESDMQVDEPISSDNKRICSEVIRTQMGRSPEHLLSCEYLLNSPIATRPSKACMVKIYSDFDGYPLNSVIDVVGFLSVNPMLDGSTNESSEYEDSFEYQAANPPPSLIPRLHAVAVKKLEHLNPLLDISFISDDGSSLNTEAIHKDLNIVLTQILFGDSIAAEYLLSHLISTVYLRTDTQPLGQFTLNISNIPSEVIPEYTSTFYEILELLLPASHYFPMTLENMNTLQFSPKKDYKTNKLVSGLLQLAPHTHLVLDETRLQPGKLENNGVLGVHSLAYLIKTQQFKCNFEFYELDFNANIPVLILSEGKSMLPSDFQLPLKVDPECVNLMTETLKAAKHYLQPKLNAIRKYLTKARIQQFNMNEANSEMIQQDFVEMRKADKKIGAEHLHLLLVLSRLLGIARGKLIMDQSSWVLAKDLEVERRKRIEDLRKK